jgi:hypothetical protein
MTTYSDLIAALRKQLAEYKYTEFQEIPIPSIGMLHAIMTPRRWMVRYVCALYEIPTAVTNAAMLTEVFNQIRNQLFAQYARFPWWKELGTFLVLLCSHEQYEQLAVHTDEFKDHSGLHGNVMLGTILIDRERFRSSADATWGLIYSGKHFAAIARTVREWCKTNLTTDCRVSVGG